MNHNVHVNITIPVYNRFILTQRTLLALNKARGRGFPLFIVTVVNNGSDQDTSERLLEFKRMGLIDKLFVLPKNMGIACACNIGWDMTPDAPFYMKLDNDFALREPNALGRLFTAYSHIPSNANIGPATNLEQIQRCPQVLETLGGKLGLCTSNLRGSAIVVPRLASDILGKWNEDYNFHGADDGDYGVRMSTAGFPQYYYEYWNFFDDLGTEDYKDYLDRGLDKRKESSQLFLEADNTVGMFVLNLYLYRMCVRNWHVPRRYEIVDVDERHVVQVRERLEYQPVKEALEKCRAMLTREIKTCGMDGSYRPEFVESLKEIMRSCGQCLEFQEKISTGE